MAHKYGRKTRRKDEHHHTTSIRGHKHHPRESLYGDDGKKPMEPRRKKAARERRLSKVKL